MSLNACSNEKCLKQNLSRKSKHFYVQTPPPPPHPKIVPFEIMWKNIAEPDRQHGDMAHARCMLDL
jgi:hypothetical protein